MLQHKREIQVQGVQRHSRVWSSPDDREMEFIPDELREEDPLEVLGKFIAAKSKSLWRRVSSKGKQSGKEETGTVDGETITDGEPTPFVPSRPPNDRQLPSSSDLPEDAEFFFKNEIGRTVDVSSSESS
jgi:hypothetical protein